MEGALKRSLSSMILGLFWTKVFYIALGWSVILEGSSFSGTYSKSPNKREAKFDSTLMVAGMSPIIFSDDWSTSVYFKLSFWLPRSLGFLSYFSSSSSWVLAPTVVFTVVSGLDWRAGLTCNSIPPFIFYFFAWARASFFDMSWTALRLSW